MTRRALVVAPLISVAIVAGCSGGAESESPTAANPNVVSSTSPTATPSEPVLGDGSTAQGAHEELVPESTSAGPLTVAAMPAPKALGPGWAFDVIDGDPHDEGFVGNQAATHQRDPAEVAMLSVPFGCERRTSTKLLATHVLDATYTDGSRRAVAMRLRFDTATAAADFLSARHDDLVACAAQKPAYDGRSTVSEVARARGATVSQRTEPGVPGHWAEVAVDVGEGDVIVLAVPDLKRRATTALARRLDTAVR